MIREVATREFLTRSRTRAYRGITALLLVLAILGPIAVAVWPEAEGGPREVTVGLADNAGNTRQQLLSAVGGDRVRFQFVDLTDRSGTEIDLVLRGDDDVGDIDVAIDAGPTLAWQSTVDDEVAAILGAALQQEQIVERAERLGIDDAAIGELLSAAPVDERVVDEDESGDIKLVLAFIGLVVAFVMPQVFGQLTMMGVVEEKSTRVIEVLLSHVRPRTLLAGKTLGIGALAVLQLAVVLAGLLGALLLTTSVSVPAEAWTFLPILAVSVLAGLAIYTTLFALLGSLISRQEDASQVMLPAFIPLMGGYFVAQTAAFGTADSLVAKVLTFIPLTTSMLLPVRVARGAIEPWEVVVAMASMALGIVVLLRVAARLYEFTLLHSGSRVGWRQALELVRTQER